MKDLNRIKIVRTNLYTLDRIATLLERHRIDATNAILQHTLKTKLLRVAKSL